MKGNSAQAVQVGQLCRVAIHCDNKQMTYTDVDALEALALASELMFTVNGIYNAELERLKAKGRALG